ncbi:hypothetical protein [Paenibacillus senegalensis]|uniref:hypothetical protein n=1 Tax=Paenibacillus senegalensis TaxID=1465766 RepID=UPI000289695E|nr:hypothetical protein [Paenibacillus senegalensis]
MTVYEITDLGRQAAYSWIREMISTPAQEFLEFPAAVSFLALLTPEDVGRLFKERVQALEHSLARLKDQFRKGASLRLPRLFLLESEHQQALLEAEIRWVQAVMTDIESGELAWNMEELRKHAKSVDNRVNEIEI